MLKKMKIFIRNLCGMFFFYGGLFHLFRFLNNIQGRRLTILRYHRITDNNIEQIESSLPYLFIKSDTLEKQLRFLKKYYTIINFERLKKHIESNAMPWNSLIIIFDDGYEDFYHKAYPELRKLNLPATLFLVVDRIGKVDLKPFWWDRAYYYLRELQKYERNGELSENNLEIISLFKKYKKNASKLFSQLNKWETKKIENLLDVIQDEYKINHENLNARNKILNWQQIFEMAGNIEFGSHTYNHPNLPKLDQSQRYFEIVESKKLIEGKLKKKIVAFSYPAGEIDNDVKNLVKNAAYEFAISTETGLNDLSDCYDLRGINIWEGTCLSKKGGFSKSIYSYTLLGLRSTLWKSFTPKTKNSKVSQTKKIPLNTKVLNINEQPRKINILFIIDFFWHVGGTEKHLYYLAKNLNKNKFNCFIVVFDLKEMFIKKIRAENVQIYHVPIKRNYTFNAFLKAFKLYTIIKENRIDIVQTYHFKSDTYGVLVSKLTSIKHIISSRRDTGDIKKKRHILLNKIMNTQINKFITVCDAVGERISTIENIPRYKQITIYNGVDLENFTVPGKEQIRSARNELGIGDDDFVIGMVAIFRPEKNYDIFFEGIKIASEIIKELRVIVVGYGPLLDYFKEYIKKINLSDHVLFTGETENTAKYISIMDVACLVPGSNEGFSNAILEKMAMGKPLVVTDVGGNAEAVQDGFNGIVIPPFDHYKLSEAIIYLYNNPSTREEMGKRSRQRVEQLFSLEKMIKNHEKLYEDIYYKHH